MNFQNDKYTLEFAKPEDDAGIRAIFEAGAFPGGISVQYLRNPSPLESFAADGEEQRIMVIRDNDCNKVIAVGGAVLRQEYVNGRIEKCGYLTGLKLHPDYQKKTTFIAKSYEFLYENISDCYCFYTTILDDNAGAIALLEKKHKHMPEYHYLGHYTTYCFHGGKGLVSLEKNNRAGWERLMKENFSKQSLTPADPEYLGFGERDFYCVREQGEIIACCFVGNQQRYKQYHMNSYGGIYQVLSKLPTHWFGYPRFPKADTNVDFGVVSYLYVKDYDKKLCSDFLRSVAAESGYALLLWGGFENNPLCRALDAMKTVRYGSRLYSVIWDREVELNGVLGVEAALL